MNRARSTENLFKFVNIQEKLLFAYTNSSLSFEVKFKFKGMKSNIEKSQDSSNLYCIHMLRLDCVDESMKGYWDYN